MTVWTLRQRTGARCMRNPRPHVGGRVISLGFRYAAMQAELVHI